MIYGCKFRDYFRIIQNIRELNFPKRQNNVSLQEKQRNAMRVTMFAVGNANRPIGDSP